MTRRLLSLTVVLGALSGCSDPAAPFVRQVKMSVTVLEFSVLDSGQFVRASLSVEVRNTGPETVFYKICSTSLQRRAGGAWDVIERVPCLLDSSRPTAEIPPGGQFTHTLWARGLVGGTGRWGLPLEGPYRITSQVHDGSRDLEKVVSEPFVVIPEVQ